MKRIIRLTESDLTRIVRRVINEQGDDFRVYGISSIVYTKPGEVKNPYFQGEGLDIFLRDNNGDGVYYQCVTDPAIEKGMKFRKLKNPDTGKMENTELDPAPRGSMMDVDGNKLVYEKIGKEEFIKGTLIKKGWEKFLPQWCEGVYAWYNQEKAKLDAEATQIANAEAEKQKQGEKVAVQKEVQNAIAKGYLKKTVGPDGTTKYTSLGRGNFKVGMFQHNLPKGTDMTEVITDSLK